MKTARLIKRNEIPTTITPEAKKTETVKSDARRVVSTWIKEREQATPTHARHAFAALFNMPAGQVSC